MAGMKFVNIHGQAMNPAALQGTDSPSFKRKPKAVAAAKADEAEKFLGWLVKGFHPDQVAEAERQHKRKKEEGQGAPAPFVAEQWMNGATPRRISLRPYQLKPAADQCADMARKAGWLRVTIEGITR